MKPYFITTAIDYTNGTPHIGHAYEKILGDVIARYQRQSGRDVFFMTGVDQHGQKVQQAAEKQGISSQEFTDATTQHFLNLWKQLSISYDQWAATTAPLHHQVVRSILTDLVERDWLYKASYQGYYSVRQEQFLTDKERNEHGEFGAEWGEVVFIEEENWYFRLSRCQQWLTQFLQKTPHFITPAFRKSELQNAVEKITGDLCISRPKNRLAWGIELPFDPHFVTYVWFDALINYISFAGYHPAHSTEAAKKCVAPVLESSSASSLAKPDFSKLWPCDYHLIGKDILIPAHGIYWPCMLHAIGFSDEEMPQLLVHGFWNFKGEKMSKSLGNIIDPKILADEYGASALRYYLMRDITMGRDADFSEERLVGRYNTELANALGNLLNRTVSMIHRYRGGHLKNVLLTGECLDHRTKDLCSIKLYREQMDALQIHAALEIVVELLHRANAFVDTMAPWKLAKNPESAEQLDAVLVTLLQSIQVAATLLMPVVPTAAEEVFQQLQLEPLSIVGELAMSLLPEGYTVGTAKPLFPKIINPAEVLV